ncbi:hypothetical protein [Lacticaseibacillus parakribbianus]|uniref:hypothetical protein n=1 Tax=Lacticaseibacillus parakribbianus TaxID=2970927 RepID=UPI0021CB7150|nr:hypothetical protein [Lacticaseibacillus parakribbianus]
MRTTKQKSAVILTLDGYPVAPQALTTADWHSGASLDGVALLVAVANASGGPGAVLLAHGRWYRSDCSPAQLIAAARDSQKRGAADLAACERQVEAELGVAALPWSLPYLHNHLVCLTRSPTGSLWLGMGRVYRATCLGPAGFSCQVRLGDGRWHVLRLVATPMSPATFVRRCEAAGRLRKLVIDDLQSGRSAFGFR